MSNEVKTKEKVNLDPKYLIKLTVTLFLTCCVVAGALGAINMVTEGPIAAINKAKTEAAMKAVVADPDGSTFSEALEITADMSAAAASAGGTVTEAYEVQAGGAAAGYALKVVASGSQGSIEMMVGVGNDGSVLGISIIKHAETPSLGAVAAAKGSAGENFRDSFVGLSGTVAVSKDGGEADTISGATITSRAVANGVNAALAIVAQLG